MHACVFKSGPNTSPAGLHLIPPAGLALYTDILGRFFAVTGASHV